MAKKKKRAGSPGGGDMEAQISRLEELVRPKGVKAANAILEGYDPGVIKLAFKYIRKREKLAGPTGLGSRIEGLLEQMPASEAEKMRASLLKAKAAQAEA